MFMQHCIPKRVFHSAKCSVFSSSLEHKLCFLHLHSLTTKTNNPKSKSANQYSFAVNHLIKPSGFSTERALKASNEIKSRIPEKTEAFIEFFKKHGFSQAQISCLVRKYPALLRYKLEDNLLPKIEFFHSLGISRGDTAKILCTGPRLLSRSLENQIVPSFNYVKNLLNSNEDTVLAIKRYPAVLQVNVQDVVPPNVERLLMAGVPDDKILHLFKMHPRVLLIQPDSFSNYVECIAEMGFNPRTTNFLSGLYVMRMVAGLDLSKKIGAYKKWGYSGSQLLTVFRRYPWCMATSDNKIDEVMDYFVGKMGYDPSILMTCPQMFSMSLEKTLIPRCSVYQLLVSKGLIRKNTSLGVFLKLSKKTYLEKYVLCFLKEAPELLNYIHQNCNHQSTG